MFLTLESVRSSQESEPRMKHGRNMDKARIGGSPLDRSCSPALYIFTPIQINAISTEVVNTTLQELSTVSLPANPGCAFLPPAHENVEMGPATCYTLPQ